MSVTNYPIIQSRAGYEYYAPACAASTLGRRALAATLACAASESYQLLLHGLPLLDVVAL
jgi:hypothetical protein